MSATLKTHLHIGLDDTDSRSGMCTTYVAALVLERLTAMGAVPLDYPHLVRLNPNCPYKTRGNAAVSIQVGLAGDILEEAKGTVLKTVETNYERGYGDTQPGVAFLASREVPSRIVEFGLRAVREMVEVGEAWDVAEETGVELYGINGGRGVVGALASIGCPLYPHTYEAIAYRTRENWGTVRRVDRDSVHKLQRCGISFDSLDLETGEIRVTPHTPCPVLAGVRALSAENALKGLGMLKFLEDIALVLVFKTNQATDMHITPAKISQLKPYSNGVVTATISGPAWTIRGGHTFIAVRDETGELICAAYRPTGRLRTVLRGLRVGDVVRVAGGVKPKEQGLTLNLEKLEVLALAESYLVRPPKCEDCGGSMKSRGRGRGYRCKRCGRWVPSSMALRVPEERTVGLGGYEVATSARRHLSKPLELEMLAGEGL
ncbi:MAG: tRNA(Ile)(2)-agmatinylcytidine synthase [Nitrososphaerota archaeon]